MEKNAQDHFAPFIAINQFMLPEFRQEVLGFVFKNQVSLSARRRSALNQSMRSLVKIPGFRSSDLAPVNLKIRHAGKAFERHSDLVAQLLSAWVELKHDLSLVMYDLLTERGWTILPLEEERARKPGFRVTWPDKETYETLDAAVEEKRISEKYDRNDIRLMSVWLSLCLPFDDSSGDSEEVG